MSTRKPKTEAEQIEADKAELAKPWMQPDYTGPLSADQAAWRNLHIDRLAGETKPAKAVETK